MNVGEIWGYRAAARHRLTPVEVLRLGTKKPARVEVRFQADDAEGRVEWVPPARLKVLWHQAAAFEADEQRMQELGESSPLDDSSPEWIAAEHVFDE